MLLERKKFREVTERVEALVESYGHRLPRQDLIQGIKDWVKVAKAMLPSIDAQESDYVELSAEQALTMFQFDSQLRTIEAVYKV